MIRGCFAVFENFPFPKLLSKRQTVARSNLNPIFEWSGFRVSCPLDFMAIRALRLRA